MRAAHLGLSGLVLSLFLSLAAVTNPSFAVPGSATEGRSVATVDPSTAVGGTFG